MPCPQCDTPFPCTYVEVLHLCQRPTLSIAPENHSLSCRHPQHPLCTGHCFGRTVVVLFLFCFVYIHVFTLQAAYKFKSYASRSPDSTQQNTLYKAGLQQIPGWDGLNVPTGWRKAQSVLKTTLSVPHTRCGNYKESEPSPSSGLGCWDVDSSFQTSICRKKRQCCSPSQYA